MPHQVSDATVFETVMELLTDAGFDRFAESFRLLVNQAMRIERSDALGAKPYQRTDDRKGYTNEWHFLKRQCVASTDRGYSVIADSVSSPGGQREAPVGRGGRGYGGRRFRAAWLGRSS